MSFSVGTDAKIGKDLLREVSRPGYHHIAALDTAAAGGDGGTGVSFDWSFAKEIRNADPLPGVVGGSALRPMPVLLAGGLTAENVAQAIQTATPLQWIPALALSRRPEGSRQDQGLCQGCSCRLCLIIAPSSSQCIDSRHTFIHAKQLLREKTFCVKIDETVCVELT